MVETSCLSTKKTKCLTHNLWNNLTNHISFFLNSVSIKDVTDNSYEPLFKLRGKHEVMSLIVTETINWKLNEIYNCK